eukprot:8086-Heterococcus_DN1.PRE.2
MPLCPYCQKSAEEQAVRAEYAAVEARSSAKRQRQKSAPAAAAPKLQFAPASAALGPKAEPNALQAVDSIIASLSAVAPQAESAGGMAQWRSGSQSSKKRKKRKQTGSTPTATVPCANGFAALQSESDDEMADGSSTAAVAAAAAAVTTALQFAPSALTLPSAAAAAAKPVSAEYQDSVLDAALQQLQAATLSSGMVLSDDDDL